jgi:hypothetical protein
MLARWLRRRRSSRARRAPKLPPKLPPNQVYENPYRNGICAADWTKK